MPSLRAFTEQRPRQRGAEAATLPPTRRPLMDREGRRGCFCRPRCEGQNAFAACRQSPPRGVGCQRPVGPSPASSAAASAPRGGRSISDLTNSVHEAWPPHSDDVRVLAGDQDPCAGLAAARLLPYRSGAGPITGSASTDEMRPLRPDASAAVWPGLRRIPGGGILPEPAHTRHVMAVPLLPLVCLSPPQWGDRAMRSPRPWVPRRYTMRAPVLPGAFTSHQRPESALPGT